MDITKCLGIVLFLIHRSLTMTTIPPEGDHYYDESCSDVDGCYCYFTGLDYAAECSDQNIEMIEIPSKLAYNITLLKMYRTQLQSVTAEDVDSYRYLRVIDLSQNQLESIASGFLDAYPQLEEFHVYINKLISLPNNLFSFNNKLKEIRAEFNQISQLPSLRGLTELTFLNFQDNEMESIASNVFVDCQQLSELHLSNNKIKSLQDRVFSGLDALTVLDLSNNEIATIATQSFVGLDNLVTVYLNDNLLTSIPADIFKDSATTLKNLELSGNRLTSMDDSAFATPINLHSLHLGSNQLSTVPNALNSLTGLVSLNLRNNTFGSIIADSFVGLTTLEELFLDDMTSLTSVNVHAFRGLVNLKRLSLGGNPGLEEFTPQHLPGPDHPNIEEIYLHRCGFTFLDELVFSDKSTLRHVDVYGNKLNCSCDLKWMPRVVAEGVSWANHWMSSSTPPTCYTPIHIRDWPIPSMVEADMTCVELTIEGVSPQAQTVHLRSKVNFTTRLYNGLPASLWYIPNQQDPIVPYPGADAQVNRIYATWIVKENNILESTLFLENSSTTDQGTYRILATNIVGNSTMDFVLNVLPYELTTTPIPETTGYVSTAVTWAGSTQAILGLVALWCILI